MKERCGAPLLGLAKSIYYARAQGRNSTCSDTCSRFLCPSLRALRLILTYLLEFCLFDDNGELHRPWLQKLP